MSQCLFGFLSCLLHSLQSCNRRQSEQGAAALNSSSLAAAPHPHMLLHANTRPISKNRKSSAEFLDIFWSSSVLMRECK